MPTAMRYRLMLLTLGVFVLLAAAPAAAQTGWICPVCGLVSHGGTEASLRTHLCSSHPNAYSGRIAGECGVGIGSGIGSSISSGDRAVQVGNAVLGIVGALGSWFDQRAKNLELSAIQQRYVEESRRQAAEALERQRLQRQLQFAREKQAVLDRMKGPKPATLQMKGTPLAGDLKMKDPLRTQPSELGAARAAADRVRDRVGRLRADLAIDDSGLLKFQRDNIEYRKAHPDAEPTPPMLTGPMVVRTADALLVGGTGWV
ncbi:MAG: hypothetical protein HY655_14845, partial [Acidobacteria bacterium]|nr:hypothetical protein [Acidobacteriota bacterium]